MKAVMNAKNKALCVAFREAGVPRKVIKTKFNKKMATKPMPYPMIAKKVYKTNGHHPTPQAVREVVKKFYAEPAKRGRPQGTCCLI